MKGSFLAFVFLIGISPCGLSAETLAPSKVEIARILNEFSRPDAQFSLPPETKEEIDHFKNWSKPLLQMNRPVVAPLLNALHSLEGESVMLTVFIVQTWEWEDGVQELFGLCVSEDQRLRHAAREVLAGIYLPWEPERRAAYGKIDLAKMLRQFHEKEGPISSAVYNAISFSLTDPKITRAPIPLIDLKWFDLPKWPEEQSELKSRDEIVKAAQHPLWNVRLAAAETAAEKRDYEIMQRFFADHDKRVVLAACEGLRQILNSSGRNLDRALSQPEFLAVLQKLAGHSDPPVRALGLLCYGQIAAGSNRTKSLSGILETNLKDRGGGVRDAALRAYQLIGPETLSEEESDRIFSIVFDDEDLGVRCTAAQLIARKGTAKAKNELRNRLARKRDESPVSRFIGLVLSEVAGSPQSAARPTVSDLEAQREAGFMSPMLLGPQRFPMFPKEGCMVETKDGEVLLSGNGYLSSVQSYRPPFVVHAEARTDATNIRLYYGKGRMIFNWELNPRQLRVHDLRDGRGFAFDGQGYVAPNEWQEIRWVVETNETRIVVNGQERVRLRGNFAGIESQIGIGTAHGSRVSVKRFTVERAGH
jgi:hypothetical protein